jgi:hypothetical protein
VRVEVWLPPRELEGARAYAFLHGMSRQIGPRTERGNVSALVRGFIAELGTPEGRELMSRLRRAGWDAASLADVVETPVRVPVRLTPKERDTVRAHAVGCGMLRGGRGDVSAFLRALIRMGCGL